MRKIATLRSAKGKVRRCMLLQVDRGVLVFTYSSLEDGCADADVWFEDLAGAEAHCRDDLGVQLDDWKSIPDPPSGCQDDWIAPVRAKGREIGQPQWGQFERLDKDGVWRPVCPRTAADAG